MQLRPETEDGLHTLRFLALRGLNEMGLPLTPLADVATQLGIPEAQLLRISQPLAEQGYLLIAPGPPVGMRLALEPTEIRLGDVIRIYEGPLRLLRSAAERAALQELSSCKLSEILVWAARELQGFLNQYTLQQILPAARARTELPGVSGDKTPGKTANHGSHLYIVPS